MRKALKFFLKTLKVLTLSVAIILFLLIIALGVFLKWPEFILNEKNLKRAAPFAAELGILIHWDKLDFELDSISFFNKRFSFEFEGLCIYQDPIQACFPQLNFATHVHWDKGIQINEVGPVYIKDARLFYYMKQEKEEKKSNRANKNPFEFNSPQIFLPDFLQKTKFKDLSIHFKKIYLIGEEGIQKFSLDLQEKHNDKFQLQSIQVNLDALQTPWLEKGKLNLDLTSPSYFLTNQWNLKMDIDLIRKGGQQIIAQGQVRPKEQNVMS
ncbi:MAG: hypothetical protein H7A32_05880, partial [Deltaproteobacteria bacterium]|nr:hypothetical protein [Deltaproteobacteria bacterium]